MTDIAADELTAIIYAFVDVSPGGECVSADPLADQTDFPQLRQLKQQYPQRILSSVIGTRWIGY